MKYRQYTIRNIHPELDQIFRDRAAGEKRSLNSVLLEALQTGAGLRDAPRRNPDFDDLAGSWVTDPECEETLDAMREQIDPELWK